MALLPPQADQCDVDRGRPHTIPHCAVGVWTTGSFAAFGGVPRRGIYDNMKTAVDTVGCGKERSANARFEAMCGHYLFEPEFCNRAAGWEKGIVEKNVQDRRRQIWHEAALRRWETLEILNEWVARPGRCGTRSGTN